MGWHGEQRDALESAKVGLTQYTEGTLGHLLAIFQWNSVLDEICENAEEFDIEADENGDLPYIDPPAYDPHQILKEFAEWGD